MAETRGLGSPDILWLGAAWLFYYASHSVLATTWFRRRAERRLGPRGTRLLFVAVSSVGLAALLVLSARMPGKPAPAVLRWPAAALVVASAWLTLAAMSRYGVRGFMGLAHESRGLLQDGLFATWRHPLYSAGFLLLAALAMLDWSPRSLVVVVVSGAYLWLGTLLEERKLLAAHGDAYRRHLARTRRFLPMVDRGP